MIIDGVKWRFNLADCQKLKQLNFDLMEFLEFANAQDWHACGNDELIDAEFLCCCERARHAIKDFTNQGLHGTVSECFPVALNALSDLQWCLGMILRHGNERYDRKTEIDAYMRRLSKMETDLKQFVCELVKVLESENGHNDSYALRSEGHMTLLRFCQSLQCIIKDCITNIYRMADAPCSSDGLHALQSLRMFLDENDQIRKYVKSSFPAFLVSLASAMESLEFANQSLWQSGSLPIFIRLADDRHKAVLSEEFTKARNVKHINQSLLDRLLKRQSNKIGIRKAEGWSLTFFENAAWEVRRFQSDEFYTLPSQCQTGTTVYLNSLLRFHNTVMYHSGKGRDPVLLHGIEDALNSLGLPESSLHEQGPSHSRAWETVNGSGSVRLPPGLNVDDLGEIRHVQDLGEGSQGKVYEALWMGKKVAVKEVHYEARSEGLMALEFAMRSTGKDSVSKSELDGELDVLKTLNHPNIVELIGYTRNSSAPDSYGLVMELMECSFADLMSKGEELSDLAKVDTLLQIARGMQYLHGVGIMHRDLKPANILIRELTSDASKSLGYMVAKLADFGLSKPHGKSAAWHTPKQGTTFYMAPEVRKACDDDKSRYAVSADVFSFGTTCFNVLTGQEKPFTQEGHPLHRDEFYRVIEKGDLDGFVINGRSKIALLVRQCWSHNPKKRPTFFNISQILENEKREILCPSTCNSQP